MRFTDIAAIAVCLLPGLSAADCIRDSQMCEWYGSWPNCGDTSANIGDVDEPTGTKLVTWTKDEDRNPLCRLASEDPLNPGSFCCSDYGAGCITGYKRLWCK
jgi:hypothetical protein